MSDNLSNSPDLSSLGMDLESAFRPAWAKEDAPDSGKLAKMAERFDREDPRHDRPRDHRGFRKGGGGQDRGQRRGGPGEKPQGVGGDRRRDQRSEGRGDKFRGKRDGGRGRFDKDRRDERPERPPALGGWEIRFLPEARGLEGISKQIKTLARAFPMFDLARLVLEQPVRYRVEFKPGENPQPLFQALTDSSLWPSESAALEHILKTDLEQFYIIEKVQIGEPKGSYAFVAEVDGVLLGPPNHHEYQSKLKKLHAERYARMPFEAFKGRIKILRDEESIARWREEQSFRTEYVPRSDDAPEASPEPAISESPAEEKAPNEAVASAEENLPTEAAPVAETAAAEEHTPEAEAEASEPAAEATPVPAAPRFTSLDEVLNHFRAVHGSGIVRKVEEKVIVPGVTAWKASSPMVGSLVRQSHEALVRFPLPMAHEIGQALTAQGLHIFKGPGKILFLAPARPKPLDRSQDLAGGVRKILDYLEAHPNQNRAEQWKGLVAQCTEESDEKAREALVAADVRWLLVEGHVIDYANRGLQVVKPKPPKEPQQQPKAKGPKPAPKPVATPPAEESAVQQPVSPESTPSSEVSEPEPITVEDVSAEETVEEIPAPVEMNEPTQDAETEQAVVAEAGDITESEPAETLEPVEEPAPEEKPIKE